MKRSSILLVALLTSVAFSTTALASPATDTIPPHPATPNLPAAHWKAFSVNLVKALLSDNEGLKLAALQHVINYGDAVNVEAAKFEIVRLYRDHEKERVRRMAVVALGAMHDEWAIDFLKRSVEFEPSDEVRQTMQAVLASYYATE